VVTAAVALEKPEPEARLESLDRVTERGGREPQFGRGTGEASQAGYSGEGRQIIEIASAHHPIPLNGPFRS